VLIVLGGCKTRPERCSFCIRQAEHHDDLTRVGDGYLDDLCG
jgi:hypothetical protein